MMLSKQSELHCWARTMVMESSKRLTTILARSQGGRLALVSPPKYV